MTETETAEEQELAAVLDPDEYTQHRRLREIFDLRQSVQEYRENAELMIGRGQISRFEANRAYLSAMQSYLMELEPLALKKYPGVGERYWYQADLGTTEFSPPTELTPPSEAYRLEQPADPREEQFVGLRSVLETEIVFEYEFTAIVDPRRGSPEEVSQTGTYVIPRSILNAAYRNANHFLADIGMDLDPESNDDPHVSVDEFI